MQQLLQVTAVAGGGDPAYPLVAAGTAATPTSNPLTLSLPCREQMLREWRKEKVCVVLSDTRAALSQPCAAVRAKQDSVMDSVSASRGYWSHAHCSSACCQQSLSTCMQSLFKGARCVAHGPLCAHIAPAAAAVAPAAAASAHPCLLADIPAMLVLLLQAKRDVEDKAAEYDPNTDPAIEV